MTESKVLLLDDDNATLAILSVFLKNKSIPHVCYKNPEEALKDLPTIEPDIIITDYHMSPINGIDLCKILRKENKWYYIIFTTADNNLELLLTAFQAGANDFIKKPISAFELTARLLNANHVVNLIKQQELTNMTLLHYSKSLEQQTKELNELIMIDPLTKLKNRRYAEFILDKEWKNTIRTQNKFSIIAIDIDKFKNINDTYGHDIGDEVLVHISNTILSSTRQNDVVCRIGGEEFYVISINMLTDDIPKLCEKIRYNIESNQPEFLHLNHKITVSVGASHVDIIKDASWKDCYRRADIALYKAKNNGRNRVEIHE